MTFPMSETRVRVILIVCAKTDVRHRLADKIRHHKFLWFWKKVKIVAHRCTTGTCTGSSLCISYEAVICGSIEEVKAALRWISSVLITDDRLKWRVGWPFTQKSGEPGWNMLGVTLPSNTFGPLIQTQNFCKPQFKERLPVATADTDPRDTALCNFHLDGKMSLFMEMNSEKALTS